ncbi:hypothetical protein EI42_03170 [Thermosporothrix hazakensis]|jgi:recombinational DNA repair ATPase RecF|uniref:Uncharacterized protein n=1 Tax=Thermosporothrix hazakensis TaxID=644383 RepID=A0A326U970_THEHA|nr:hypothetical protein [Thermosporothrix hazakensis]PZW28416.1 hypothetical protein EI42_03170 [Thermosporothrix hazakensis]GCE45196.1 hypothetical protein KTH_00650 [Thermosporothrix hazakensis]
MSRTYCKAYQLKEMRQFEAWQERAMSKELTDETIVYLWDDFTVALNPIQPEVLFDHVTPQWQTFCQTVLGFRIPEELADKNKFEVQEVKA